MDVVSIFVRLWVAISMVLLLNMDISRAISRLSRPLAISMVICLWMINLNLVIRVRPVDILVAITTVAISSLGRSLLVIMHNLISIRSVIMVTVLVNIRLSMSMVIAISWFSRSLMYVVSIFVRLWVPISMILLLNMDISRAISRLSRPLPISMVICLWMINLNLVIRVRPVDILVAITTMAISSFSRSLLVIMLNLISIRSMIMITVLVNIRLS